MTNIKHTKRALLSSVMALFLCFAMLLGTTYAWFTDSVASGSNVITAGNLDINVEYTLDGETWKALDGADDLFQKSLWEPGHTEVVALKITNNGSLALKYTAQMNITKDEIGKNKDGGDIVLSEILTVSTLVQQANDAMGIGDITLALAFNGENSVAYETTTAFKNTNVLKGTQELFPGDSHYAIIKVDMPETVGNEANHDGVNVPSIEFGIDVLATQYSYENDSFGNGYDADAPLPEVITNATDLAAALTANEKEILVALSGDVNLPISSLGQQTGGSGEYKLGGKDTDKIVIDLKGHKLNITTTYWSGIGAVNPNATIVIKNGTMTSSQATGTWNSYDVTFANCNYIIENVVFDKAIAFTNAGKSVSMSNVTINETHDYYALWISAKGQTVEIDGLTVNSDGRAIKIDEQYVDAPAKVTLNVSNAIVKSTKKAAIIVKSAAGADITVNNVNVANTVDPVHTVWVDEDAAAYADLVTVTGGEKANEAEVAINLTDLQSKINNATDGAYIELVNDITGDVTVTQKADVKITIDGNNKTFAGVLLVDGKSGTYITAGLTIQNVNFKADSISADACIRLGDGTTATRYTCNVTISNCTFDVPGAVGVKSYTGGDKNLTITGCTATANAHSLVQAKGIDGILVQKCEVNSKNGLNFNNSTNVTVDECTVDVKGYAVRFGESSGGEGAAEVYFIKNCSLKSANDDGDATIILRGTADNSTLTIVNTTIEGTPDITNTATGATVVK